MDRDPRRSGDSVQQGVQDRPIGDRIRAVLHPLGLAVGGGDRASIEVVASDYDRGGDLPGSDQFVEREACFCSLTVAEPADPRGKPLEGHLLLCLLDPAVERLVLRKEVEDHLIGAVDVLRIAGEGDPAERPFPLAEHRSDIGGDEAWEAEGLLQAAGLCLTTQVVPVVEDDCSAIEEPVHRFDVPHHRSERELAIAGGVLLAQSEGFVVAHPPGNVAIQFIVSRGLIGDDIGDDPAGEDLWKQVGGVS